MLEASDTTVMSAADSDRPNDFRLTDLAPLPEEWKVVVFGRAIRKGAVKIGKVQRGRYLTAGRFPIIDQGQHKIAGYWDNVRDVYDGQLPVIVYGDHTRTVKYVDVPFVVGADGTKILVPNTDLFNPWFLYAALQNVEIPSRGYNRHFSTLREKSLPCPPLQEQRAIAHALRTVQKAKEATERVIAATRELRKSLTRHLFSYGPVSVDQADRVQLKEARIGLVPEHWSIARLGDVAEIERGKFAHRPRNDPRFFGGSVPFIQTGDVVRSGGRIASFSQTLNALGLSVSRIFPKGTIVLTIAANIGDTGVLEFDSAFPDSLVGITPHALVETNFLAYYLSTQKVEMDRLAPRGTQKNINIQFLRPWPVPVPPPDEQRQIRFALDAVSLKLKTEAHRKTALDALFSTLLYHLMSGKVRLKAFDLGPGSR